MKPKASTLIALGLVAGLCLTPAAALGGVSPENDSILLTNSQEIPNDATTEDLTLPPTKGVFLGPGGATVRSYSATAPRTALFHGTLSPWEGDESRMALYRVNENGEKEAEVVLTITEETRILNAVTGDPLTLSDIRPEETCYVYTTAYMAMSYPAQAGALMILAGIPADFAVPSFVEVDTVRQEADGTVVLGTDFAMNVTLTDDTNVFPYLTKNLVTKDMIQPGHQLLIWHGPVALSYPSQTTATKVMVFPYGYRGYVSLDGDKLQVGGEDIVFTSKEKMRVDGETCLLPLRLVLEQMGLDILWTAEDNSIPVSQNGTLLYTLTLGSENALIDGTEQYLSRPVTMESGISYLALDDFLTLHKFKIETLF